MVRVGGLLLVISLLTGVFLRRSDALLTPLRPVTRRRHSLLDSHTCRRLVSWRGGGSEEGGVDMGRGGQPMMNFRLGLVRAAGYGIITGSLCLKTPQIVRVWRAKSLVGLAPASIYADVFLFGTSVIYHVLKRNPFRAYGETAVVLVQTMVMVGLLWRYGGADDADIVADGGGSDENSSIGLAGTGVVVRKPAAVAAPKRRSSPGGGPIGRVMIVLGTIAATAACVEYLPEPLWGLLVIVSTPTLIVVQGPQIVKNFRQKHTGEQAMLTVLLAFLGCSVRIVTTILDLGGDPWLLLNYVVGAFSNAAMLSQIWVFREKTAEVRRRVADFAKKQYAD